MSGEARNKTAFVLSGGGSLGAIEVGMVRALFERGVKADLFVATSAGAINGAFLASRPQTAETAIALGDIWRGLSRGDVFPVSPLIGLLGFAGRRNYLIPNRGLTRLIKKYAQVERLEQLSTPLHAVASDALSGEEVLLSEGPLRESVLASSAIPGALPPVWLGGRLLADGGVANNTPISRAVELGASTVYVLPTGNTCALIEPPKGALEMGLHAISLLTMRRLIVDIERYRDRCKLIVLPPPCPLEVTPIDFGRAEELIQRALGDARKFLDEGGEEKPPIQLRMHHHGS